MVERIAYTVIEACEALRVGRTKLYELISEGKIKAVALGGKTLIPRVEVDRLLESLPSIRIRYPNEARNDFAS